MAGPTYSHSAWKVTAYGIMYGGAETWASSFWLGTEGADAPQLTGPDSAAIATRWQTFFTNGNIGGWVDTEHIKLSHIGADGKTILADTIIFDYTTPPHGGYGGFGTPSQLAYSIDMRSTTYPRGVASHGRMFIPGVNPGIQGNGKMDSAIVNNIATAFQTFLQGVNTDMSSHGCYVINNGTRVTRKSGAIDPARNARVTEVHAGDVMHTQRRRMNNLKPVYTVKGV